MPVLKCISGRIAPVPYAIPAHDLFQVPDKTYRFVDGQEQYVSPKHADILISAWPHDFEVVEDEHAQDLINQALILPNKRTADHVNKRFLLAESSSVGLPINSQIIDSTARRASCGDPYERSASRGDYFTGNILTAHEDLRKLREAENTRIDKIVNDKSTEFQSPEFALIKLLDPIMGAPNDYELEYAHDRAIEAINKEHKLALAKAQKQET